jgi:hypothetical protein
MLSVDIVVIVPCPKIVGLKKKIRARDRGTGCFDLENKIHNKAGAMVMESRVGFLL